ncbi:MAG TPA: hypothetical protein DCX14_04420 [Flavobacteriales bacterium]|nr:hypothetical protein [Flavobacteriales bacterium]
MKHIGLCVFIKAISRQIPVCKSTFHSTDESCISSEFEHSSGDSYASAIRNFFGELPRYFRTLIKRKNTF